MTDRSRGAASEVEEMARRLAEVQAEFDAAPAHPAEYAVPVTLPERRPFRVIVATDWSSATVPYAVLRAYAQLIPVEAPVTLVFAVPHEVTETDLTALTAIYEGLGLSDTAPLGLESFDEAATTSAHAVIVPPTDPDALAVEIAECITTLATLAILVRDPDRLAAEPEPVDADNPALRARLEAFSHGAQ